MNIQVPGWLHLAIRLLIGIGLVLVMYYQFRDVDVWTQFHSQFLEGRNPIAIWPFIFAVVLVSLNWSIECFKWQVLVPSQSFRESATVVLGGLSWSVWTPMGLGDYLGRMYTQRQQKASQTATHTLVASISQILANVCWALVLVAWIDPAWMTMWGIHWWIFAAPAFIVVLALYLLSGIFKSLIAISFQTRFILLLWSFLRSGIYILQYALVLKALGSQTPMTVSAMLVSLVYLWQTFLPVPEMLGIVLKAELAILIFSYEGIGELLAVVSALCIWTMNRFLPAVVGYIGILKMPKDESTIQL